MENLSTVNFEHLLSASVNDMKNSLSLVLQTLDGLSENELRGLNMVQYEATRMQNTLTQLLGLYLIQSNHLAVHQSEQYLIDIVEDCIEAHKSLLESKGIQVALNIDDVSWYLDPQLVSSVINIALVNAVRYTKDEISISVAEEEGYLCIHIDDNGTGYPPVVLEKFKQLLKQSENMEVSSQTLGWYYCEKIAAVHCNQGRKGKTLLTNDSDLGGGRLTLRLP